MRRPVVSAVKEEAAPDPRVEKRLAVVERNLRYAEDMIGRLRRGLLEARIRAAGISALRFSTFDGGHRDLPIADVIRKLRGANATELETLEKMIGRVEGKAS